MATITTKLLFMMTIMSIMLMMMVTFTQSTLLIEWNIIDFNNMIISLPIILDPTSTIFMTTVLIIATSVMQFTKTYMMNDKTTNRFIILILLFVSSMMFLIMFPHTMLLLLGWDGLGITSFVLVIYYNNAKSLGAGMITALTNRIGDVMLLISIALLFNQGHWMIQNIWENEAMKWIPFLIMIAAMTKSAQMPFSSWLPAAMAAPTPVSALVHSSTLVTAGVYLLYRFYPFMSTWKNFKTILIMIATMTMLMASASAMAECDMKKIIALSTLSQVAIMMFTLSLGLPEIAFFHLITHALFKALLFICAGNMIDIHHHSQDLRQMGNVSTQLPVITTAISIANMALCGAPFLAGFYSKDLIIESMTMLMTQKNLIIFLMFVLATILTTAYSARFSMYTMLFPTTSPSSQYSSENMTQIISISVLATLAVMGGAITNWIFTIPSVEPNFSSGMKILAPLMIMLGIMMGVMTVTNKSTAPTILVNSHCYMWFLTPLSTHITPNVMMKLPLMELKEVDQGWSLIPTVMFNSMKSQSSTTMKIQNNSTLTYIASVAIIISWTMLSM
uniref:NADH-ubiquinone oxidoreductase chain 5 n=1 Tax=Hediste diversicolor TaxID=126592 RepID=A0A7T8G450_HEDDI|nr:NADH dehydrogenase subunit 5 [Hediste diversicolor]QQP21533.1 NADH dehydrogenase subunit 5 [Hediste diversicolor]